MEFTVHPKKFSRITSAICTAVYVDKFFFLSYLRLCHQHRSLALLFVTIPDVGLTMKRMKVSLIMLVDFCCSLFFILFSFLLLALLL